MEVKTERFIRAMKEEKEMLPKKKHQNEKELEITLIVYLQG